MGRGERDLLRLCSGAGVVRAAPGTSRAEAAEELQQRLAAVGLVAEDVFDVEAGAEADEPHSDQRRTTRGGMAAVEDAVDGIFGCGELLELTADPGGVREHPDARGDATGGEQIGDPSEAQPSEQGEGPADLVVGDLPEIGRIDGDGHVGEVLVGDVGDDLSSRHRQAVCQAFVDRPHRYEHDLAASLGGVDRRGGQSITADAAMIGVEDGFSLDVLVEAEEGDATEAAVAGADQDDGHGGELSREQGTGLHVASRLQL
ncbi:MAG: hypothetical protein COW24_03075 [Candidatus Kerfeldbacteria bacterium CG15_BIG_FIL_POST_REV_8_21_14_020_45_12]|uniref:Uncharacterized protein n=1 Tax=Candidatus Kerfeldbacteria bacterium CG15_BIG_FIL_POST_REV_8_21_14_020_45_12 TaxID=2014247 RepID=A0A2M7H3V2_9BACT|nr:MAG: hypothetical protein COW24_03075 [Candidatus Kerfeldbacteria bacterium CG15_BIG_FIL_POST_REV_8_21_14_020_45_12]PJA92999.1 MAG: hypothetical protein CO132_05125 [Candidatus Kerfeldbacteria bacterium CG_4_9_14_3_um_filter_45_8]